MEKSLAMIEYATVSSGMAAADLLAKTADIRFLTARTVYPGKYIVLFHGELAALKSAVDAVKSRVGGKLSDSFILGNPHPSVITVLNNAASPPHIDTLGIIETHTSAAAVKAADIAAKAAKIQLMEIRLAKGMCQKAYVLFCGALASVEESVGAVIKHSDDPTVIIDHAVIPAPDKGFIEALRRDLHGFELFDN